MAITMAQSLNPDEIRMAIPDMPPETMAPVSAHDAHMAATLTQPIIAAPPEIPTMAGGAAPAKSVPAKMSDLAPVENKISGRLMADYKKDADPYGSPDNHPGFFGKLLHGLNVATGGVNRRGFEEQGLEKRLEDVSKLESEEGLQGAQGENQTAEATGHDIENANAPRKNEDTHNQAAATTAHENAETANLQNPPDTNPEMATYRSLVKLGMRPSEALQEIERDKAMGLKPTGRQHVDLQGPGNKPIAANYDPSTGKYYDAAGKEIANPVPYEKPNQAGMVTVVAPDPNNPGGGIVERVGTGAHLAPGSMTASQYGSGAAADVKQGKADAKAVKDAQDDYRLMQTLAAHPSATNDLAMVMHYIGATKPDSIGKLRLNQNEIALVMGTRSSFGDLEALAEKVRNGQKLTPEQRNDMLATMRILTQAHEGEQGGNAPIVQHSASTGQYRYSTDGGKTWQAGQPKQQ